MELVIDTYGTKIRSTGERIRIIKPKSTPVECSARKIRKIIVTGVASLSTRVMELAEQFDIDIVFLNKLGKPVGRFLPHKSRGFPTLRHKQLQYSRGKETIKVSQNIVDAKCQSQLNHLLKLEKKKGIGGEGNIASIEKIFRENKFSDVNDREKLLGIEGSVADRYFDTLRTYIPFKRRSRYSTDSFNSALNYGYGILYSEIESQCMITGLDVNIGIYHQERYGKKPLVFDLIEEFRVPIVDMVIVELFLQKKIRYKENTEVEGVYLLSKKERQAVITTICERLREKIEWKGENIEYRQIIANQTRCIGHLFTGDIKEYEPFCYRFTDI